MAWASICCNHVIAALYKIEFASNKGYIDPACTSLPCNWNKCTKKEVQPQQSSDLVIRKKKRTQKRDLEVNPEEERSKAIRSYDPRVVKDRVISNDAVSSLFNNLYLVSPESVLFRSLPFQDEEEDDLKIISLQDIAHDCQEATAEMSEENQTTQFILSLSASNKSVKDLERRTRGQCENYLWSATRKCRLTASKNHDVYTKMNSI